jgi:hypothetical protein
VKTPVPIMLDKTKPSAVFQPILERFCIVK